jgi:transcriptional regulator GlxA family with amidase domain
VQIAFLVYEGLTALDIIGPYEVLARIPGADVRFVARRAGEVTVDTGAFALRTEHALADVPRPEVFVVPGGTAGTFAAAKDEEILDWVRQAHAYSRYSTSVCTGSLILGAAGLLDGLQATTHWAAKTLLEQYGAQYTEQRVVAAGKIVTAAGVSSGIDMALWLVGELAGEDLARMVQLAIEYDPQPPFDAGSPAKAGEEAVQNALAELARKM